MSSFYRRGHQHNCCLIVDLSGRSNQMPDELKSIAENMNACAKTGNIKRLNVRGNDKLKHR